MTNNKDLNYIAECAESVGIHVDEHTAISIPFIANVMRKMREQSNSDEDCISRQEVLDNYNGVETPVGYRKVVDIEVIKNMKSVQPKTDVLDKIRAEIDRQEKWLLQAGCTTYNVDIALDAIKTIVAESEVKE